MLDTTRTNSSVEGDFVEFIESGTRVAGEYHCAGCGYGVTVHAALPRCPMCSGTTWEQAAWSPFTRTRRLQ
jgi:rubrerythrin